ncbi:sensor histidine kinase [Egbenema bharatensis]|uniref:sensor histidine kinase n=1 Tax=Egbenema bharatensis TaxID=3463334 RepID=UPI003A8642C3
MTTFSVLGLGGVSCWVGWRMQEILIDTHTDTIKHLSDRLPLDVQIYNESFPMAESVQLAIDKAPPNVLIWVEAADGEITAQSQSFQVIEPEFRENLFALYELPKQPNVYQVEQRYLVLCSDLLKVRGRNLGQMRIAQDITSNQLMLNRTMQGLWIVTGLAIVLLAAVIAWYIQRSLCPLRRISQIASTISAHDLSQAKMTLDKAPTEVRELAEKLNEMLSRLGLSWEQQRQLLGDISHELRTPLSVTYGSLQCMQRRGSSFSAMQQELLETAISETDRTIQLLQSLLDLARADNSCVYLHSERLKLNDLVADVVKLTEKAQHPLIKVNADQDIWMTTDRNCLIQILTHLLDNAAQYSPPDHPITITLSQTEETRTIEIRDYGCGMPLDQQERIFDRFYRIDHARSRATGGVGLGLSIVKTLVESMDGQIKVWSHPGEGSLFTVTLPSQLCSSSHLSTGIKD